MATNQSDAIAAEIQAHAQDPSTHLPADTHLTLPAGYAEQLKVPARQHASPRSAMAWFRGYVASEALEGAFGPVETDPGQGANAEVDAEWVAANVRPSKGHWVRGLSVAGCSVVLLVPATHTSSTAYAIAEKVSILSPSPSLPLTVLGGS